MRKTLTWLWLVVALGVFLGSGPGPVRTSDRKESGFPPRLPRQREAKQWKNLPATGEYAPDRILVRFNPSISVGAADAIIASYRAETLRRVPQIGVRSVRIPDRLTVEETLVMFNQNPDVEYAEPDYETFACEVIPNDPSFGYQYGLRNDGQTVGPNGPRGVSGADIRATRAWEETRGLDTVVVAVIDTGIDFNHPDLQQNILPGGYDFFNDDNDPTDDHEHGTRVASILAADTDNGLGMAGACWHCKILPIKGLGHGARGYTSGMMEAIVWAADQGVQVINLSNAARGPSQTLENAVKYAHDKNIVLVAAAGNNKKPVYFPAAYDDYVLAVAASDYRDQRASFSNYGPEVDVAAPGVLIFSCIPTWKVGPNGFPYNYMTGTSMATPHVSALAAMIRGLKPWLTADEVMDLIRYTADDMNRFEYPGHDPYMGYGRINMMKALVPIPIQNRP